jgi:two-component system KDP operon response regulator KdpE
MNRPAGNLILVIDDEEQIRRFLRISLRSQGYEVVEAATGKDGLGLAATRSPDLIVLDLGLPDVDGMDVLAQVRGWSAVPIVILSVRSSEEEKVSAIDAGANDYITKPFGIQEFLARVRNLLRLPKAGGTGVVYDDGHLAIDLSQRQVSVDGRPVHLTRKEFALLRALVTHQGHLLTQQTLLREIWGPSHAEDTHYLRGFIRKIRDKLGDDFQKPRYIETESGVGYRFIGRQKNP